MSFIFGIDIAQEVLDATEAAGSVGDAVLIKVTPGTRNPADLGAGTQPTTVSHPCKGFIEDPVLLQGGVIDSAAFQDDIARRGLRKVSILGASLPAGVVPRPNDRVTIKGRTYTLVTASTDPADALYACLVRGGA